MEIINLGKQNSIFNHFIREIRDVNIQKDAMRFRRNIERIGEIFAYEISKKMTYENKDTYEGTFLEGKATGKGKFTYGGLSHWEEDILHKNQWEEGNPRTALEGDFVDGKPHGFIRV